MYSFATNKRFVLFYKKKWSKNKNISSGLLLKEGILSSNYHLTYSIPYLVVLQPVL